MKIWNIKNKTNEKKYVETNATEYHTYNMFTLVPSIIVTDDKR